MNKTTVFYSPLEGDDVLVRTGVLTRKSVNDSLYHAVSHACSNEYVKMNEPDRKKFTDRLVDTSAIMHHNLKKFYETDQDVEVRTLIKDMIPIEEFRDRLRETVKKTQSSMKKLFKPLLEELRDELGDAKIKFLRNSLNSLIEEFALGSTNVDLEVLSNNFGCDIYIIDAETRMPHLGGPSETVSNEMKPKSQRDKAVVVIRVGGTHYEVVGRLMPENRIKRSFDSDDLLIKKFTTILFSPTKLTRYPELIDHLPEMFRKEHGLDRPSRRYVRSPLKSPEGSAVNTPAESEDGSDSSASETDSD